MKHIIVFAYIFTILLGVSALTIQWLAGKGDKQKQFIEMKPFILMLLVLNIYDFVLYYFDNIMNMPSGNLMLSFGDCMIAILVAFWLRVEKSFGQFEKTVKMAAFVQKYVIAYVIIWFIAVIFFIDINWIRIIIDIPLLCFLVLGGIRVARIGLKNGYEKSLLAYEGVITLLITANYITYLISESGLLYHAGKVILDITIFFWLGINMANLLLLYRRDFVESFLQTSQSAMVQGLNLEQTLDVIKEKYELTKREVEILKEVYDGKTNTQIAENMFISESTVKAHIYNIFRKLDVKSRVEAVCMIRAEKERI